jgi:hypothetical protein
VLLFQFQAPWSAQVLQRLVLSIHLVVHLSYISASSTYIPSLSCHLYLTRAKSFHCLSLYFKAFTCIYPQICIIYSTRWHVSSLLFVENQYALVLVYFKLWIPNLDYQMLKLDIPEPFNQDNYKSSDIMVNVAINIKLHY